MQTRKNPVKALGMYFIFFLVIQISCDRLSESYSEKTSENRDSLIPVESVPNLYQWTDVCNVYVFRDGDKALLIDLGNGSVLSHLPEIGVEQVEWILFTHHHREQCQGYPLLKDPDTQIAAPAAEKVLFERPSDFAKVKPSLEDPWSVFGVSYIRPPVQPIRVDRAFASMDTFTWHGHTFWCMETPGNSPGSMSYLLKTEEGWLALSGDVILRGAKMHTYFDSEWDYGYGSGLRALHNSAALLRDFHPFILLPAHGPVIKHPAQQLKAYQGKLRNLEKLLIRGYDVLTYASASQDMVSRPSLVPHVWQVSPHLFKLKGPEYFPNFSLIMSDSGHALLVDCGLIDTSFLAQSLESMKRTYGLKAIDALIITHIHGDHFLQAPYIRQKWGTPVWALENMAPILEHPLRYNLAALLPAYQAGFDSLRVDRVFKSGEIFTWEGYEFTIDWMPGQTEYALCMQGMIDGKKIAFTGDNIFGDPGNPLHSGHEALVARNSAILEEGYIYAADYLSQLKPERLVGGHSYVMDKPAKMINSYQAWVQKMQKAFRSISHENDYRYWFDPYWVHAEPYRIQAKPGQSADILVSVRNFVNEDQHYRIEIHTPSGIIAEPPVLEGKIRAASLEKLPVRVINGNLSKGVHRMAFDVTLDGRHYGEWFDAIVIVE